MGTQEMAERLNLSNVKRLNPNSMIQSVDHTHMRLHPTNVLTSADDSKDERDQATPMFH